jgi:hypothetical protein
MTYITHEHIHQLISLESGIKYNEPPTEGKDPFVVVEHESPILISAPHGARTYRNKDNQKNWHEEDEYTAGMALLLGEICSVSVIATNCKNNDYDPNFTPDLNVPYKQMVGHLIQKHHIRFVIDLHGAALHSSTLEPQQTIDLGLRQKEAGINPSMAAVHIEKLEKLLLNTDNLCDPSCFVVGRNKYAGIGKGTIITYASQQKISGTERNVQAVQIEMKPQVRIAKRFSTATFYQSFGPFQAKNENVIHMVQSLASFIDYLRNAPSRSDQGEGE